MLERLREELVECLDADLPDERKRVIFKILSRLDDSIDVHESSTELMTFLVQDLLDFAQLKAGKFRKNYSSFNIRETVKKVMRIQKKKAEAAGIQLLARFPGMAVHEPDTSQMIQPVGTSPVICCDESRLIQVLLNLQSNALKFTQEGHVKLIVEVIESKQKEQYLQVQVVDTGVGISEAN